MGQLNDTKNINDSSKIITTKRQQGKNISSMLSEKISESIYKRRNSQYIAGEIIAIFSTRDSVNGAGIKERVIEKDVKTYFLILSNKFQRNYLVCPLFSRSLLNCSNFESYEINLGIVPELETNRIIYADLSRCHYINKDEFHTFIMEQRNLLNKEGEEVYVLRLSKSSFNLITKGYKNMITF